MGARQFRKEIESCSTTVIAGQSDAEVLLVKEGGTFSEWNSQHPSEAVRIDDMISEVNGIAVDEVYEIAIRELHKASRLRQIRRGAQQALWK